MRSFKNWRGKLKYIDPVTQRVHSYLYACQKSTHVFTKGHLLECSQRHSGWEPKLESTQIATKEKWIKKRGMVTQQNAAQQ